MTSAYKCRTLDYAEGWSMFLCGDGLLHILRLDDPGAIDGLHYSRPKFKDDDAAIAFVRSKASGGSAYHAAALALDGTKPAR